MPDDIAMGGADSSNAKLQIKGEQSGGDDMDAMRKSFGKWAANDGHPLVRNADSGMDTVRKSFERWAANEGHPLVRRPDGTYVYSDVERDWHIWRAAIMYQGTPN